MSVGGLEPGLILYIDVFLHFRGANHIAGSHLSIGKAAVYSKEQDKTFLIC